MTNAQTYITGASAAVTLAAGDIVKGNGTGVLAKVAANASTTALGVVYSGATSGKAVSYVARGKTKVYVGLSSAGSSIEVGTPLKIGTGSTRGVGQVFVATGTGENTGVMVAKSLMAVSVDTTADTEVLIDAVVDFE